MHVLWMFGIYISRLFCVCACYAIDVKITQSSRNVIADIAHLKPWLYVESIQKLHSLTNIVRAFQSKLRNSKNHFGVDTRYVNVYSCPYKTSFPDHP